LPLARISLTYAMAASTLIQVVSPPQVINHCGATCDPRSIPPSLPSFHCFSVRTRSNVNIGPFKMSTPPGPRTGERVNLNSESTWPKASVLTDTSAHVGVLAVSSIASLRPFLITLITFRSGRRPDRMKNLLVSYHPSGVNPPPPVSMRQNSSITFEGTAGGDVACWARQGILMRKKMKILGIAGGPSFRAFCERVGIPKTEQQQSEFLVSSISRHVTPRKLGTCRAD